MGHIGPASYCDNVVMSCMYDFLIVVMMGMQILFCTVQLFLEF